MWLTWVCMFCLYCVCVFVFVYSCVCTCVMFLTYTIWYIICERVGLWECVCVSTGMFCHAGREERTYSDPLQLRCLRWPSLTNNNTLWRHHPGTNRLVGPRRRGSSEEIKSTTIIKNSNHTISSNDKWFERHLWSAMCSVSILQSTCYGQWVGLSSLLWCRVPHAPLSCNGKGHPNLIPCPPRMSSMGLSVAMRGLETRDDKKTAMHVALHSVDRHLFIYMYIKKNVLCKNKHWSEAPLRPKKENSHEHHNAYSTHALPMFPSHSYDRLQMLCWYGTSHCV